MHSQEVSKLFIVYGIWTLSFFLCLFNAFGWFSIPWAIALLPFSLSAIALVVLIIYSNIEGSNWK